MAKLQDLQKQLLSLSNPEKSEKLSSFFKTGKGQYGEGDIFIGVTMPQVRNLVKSFKTLSLESIELLLQSKEHEFRMAALLILIERYRKGTKETQKECYDLYLRNTEQINNWDLVDASAEHIVGHWLEDKAYKTEVLSKLAQSTLLWERRIAMLSTFHSIKQGKEEDALHIAFMLMKDKHDLIHKAVGWMLREVGKRCSMEAEEKFLEKNYSQMPRTMLRYAIEHFPEEKRKAYLKK
ncbi:MAG: DNA alkylation repair protein [Bacteroidia bacterium]|nr:DNA alkylation repair protein [Bacteroidia bacterium]MCZ2247868.1 DNA alkylation repair protein [Bacteroidia bacterium]